MPTSESKFSVSNGISLFLLFTALICLYPGVTKPILHIEVSPKLPLVGKVTLYETTRSILQTVQDLWSAKSYLVSSLIFGFSLIIPLIKCILLLTLPFYKSKPLQKNLHQFINGIGKWSMADVFVIALLLTFLATRSMQGMTANIEPGFYWFLAYCLLSIAGSQIMDIKKFFPKELPSHLAQNDQNE